jgi:hypothetical protein
LGVNSTGSYEMIINNVYGERMNIHKDVENDMSYRFDLTRVPAGVYYLSLKKDGSQVNWQKVVKIK